MKNFVGKTYDVILYLIGPGSNPVDLIVFFVLVKFWYHMKFFNDVCF